MPCTPRCGSAEPPGPGAGFHAEIDERWTMRWVTREGAKTDRVACPWLIRKFIDPQAEFLFVPKETVLEVTRREAGKSFDCPGADYTHRDGKCSFEVLIEEFRLQDPALQM